jgi:hypothetical protein
MYYSLTFTIKLYVTVSLAQRGFLAPRVSNHKGCCLNFPFWLNNYKPVERKNICLNVKNKVFRPFDSAARGGRTIRHNQWRSWRGWGAPATPLTAAADYYAGILITFKIVYYMPLHCASDSPLPPLLMCHYINPNLHLGLHV